LKNNIILLFVSGSYGDNGIDFGRSDYPGWKHTLEQEVAIAYYDKRELNKRLNKIDTSRISWDEYARDILKIAKCLKSTYQARIILMGHSAGGVLVLHHLSIFNQLDSSPIESAIVLNTPFTTDSSPARYLQYRPEFLKNIAQDYIDKENDSQKWQEALEWMIQTDSIHSIETSRIWNQYVEAAYSPQKKNVSVGMALKVIFRRPYIPFKSLYIKDNDVVGDLLWEQKQDINDESFSKQLSQINHNVLVITGQYDPIAVPEELEPISDALKREETIIIPNCGHESYLDQPKFLNDAIFEFISD
jgi:pimeloyl-ACP methyl ester carboxylesterase